MMVAFVAINCSPGRVLEVVKNTIGKPGVVEAYAIAGEFDAIAKVQGPDVQAISRIIADGIQTLDGVVRTSTWLVIT